MRKLFCRLGWHKRARNLRFRDGDGLIKSNCEGCGIRMVRERLTGRWLVISAERDVRERGALLKALDGLIGPALFVVLLLTVLAAIFLARGGVYEGWK